MDEKIKIETLRRGDLIQNIENREVWRVNSNFGDGLIIADCDNIIQTISSLEGWRLFRKSQNPTAIF